MGTEQSNALRAPGAIGRRKSEHLELALESAGDSGAGPGWTDVELIHEALPEVDLDRVDLSTPLVGRTLRAPLVIAGMTGGHDGATEVNATLARAAERHGLAIGVGSQRAALHDPSLAPTYSVVREQAPGALVIGNLGAAQLVEQRDGRALRLAAVRDAVAMVGADAIAVHLNFLEESVQPEGERRARGCEAAIGELARDLEVPVIAKETGAGIAPGTALRLRAAGVAVLDVGGSGGTNFAAIERRRAERQGDREGVAVGGALAGWGIPTAASVAGAVAAGLPVIATGGIRSGLDAAKALALGATAVGVARPLLAAAFEGEAVVDAWVERFARELATVLMLTGSSSVDALRRRRVVVAGRTRAWLDAFGADVNRGRSV